MHPSQRLPLAVILATLTTTNVACNSATPSHEGPEDITISEIISDLKNDPETSFKSDPADVQVRGKMSYSWGKANKVLQPADEALWPITITFAKNSDGTQSIINGCAVYSCPPGATGPWHYNRFWFQSSERLGVKAPPREVLRKTVLNDMRARPDYWFRPSGNYLAIREVTIPENPEYKSAHSESESWVAEAVADQKASSYRIARVRLRYEVKRNKFDGKPDFIGIAILSTKELASQEYPSDAIKSLPNLDNTPFDELFNDKPLAIKAQRPLPAESELLGAVWQVTLVTNENANRFFGKNQNDNAVTRVCRIEKPVLRPGHPPKYEGEDGRRLELDVLYTWMEKSGPNQGTVYTRPFRLRFERRAQPAQQTAGKPAEAGDALLSQYQCVQIRQTAPANGENLMTQTKTFTDAEAAEALKSIWDRHVERNLSSANADSAPGVRNGAAARDVDRTNPAAVAAAALTALRAKDLATVATYCRGDNAVLFNEVAIQGERHPRYRSIFSGWRWDMVSGWNRRIGEARLRDEGTAVVPFADVNRDEVAAVTLFLVDGKWWVDDMNRFSKRTIATMSAMPTAAATSQFNRPQPQPAAPPAASESVASAQPAVEPAALDPVAAARAFLAAYQTKELPTMANLSVGAARDVIADVATRGKAHPRYAAIFSGWRWDVAAGWDGRIGQARQRGQGDIVVRFADLADGHIAAVNLRQVDGQWGFLGIDRLSTADFQTYPLAPNRPTADLAQANPFTGH
jgi:hypothetical protein